MSEELAEGQKPLARNSACHQCRKRKLKCDAIRPVCTNCAKPRVRGAALLGTEKEACTWDEVKEISVRTKKRRETDERQRGDSNDSDVVEGSTKKSKIEELERKIAEFEQTIKLQQATASSSKPPAASEHVMAQWPGVHSALYGQAPVAFAGTGRRTSSFPPVESVKAPQVSSIDFLSGLDPPPQFKNVNTMEGFFGIEPGGVHMPKLEPDSLGASPFEMMWPDWPPSLPTLSVVEHMVNMFFDRIPTLPKMIHKATFMPSLQLPPSHPHFPNLGLLHAIIAVTSFHIPIDMLASRAYFPTGAPSDAIVHPIHEQAPESISRYLRTGTLHWNSAKSTEEGDPRARFQLWHRRKAHESITHHFDRGEKFLQSLQAHLIVSAVDSYNAWWVDLWMLAGGSVRMAIPMLLNESPKNPPDSLQQFGKIIVAPAASPLEQAERDRTWWMTYIFESCAVCSTNWATCLNDSEITVELPVLQDSYDRGIGELDGVQTLQSTDLYSHHPPRHLDSFCLFIKAVKLYIDIGTFFRSYGRGSHTLVKYATDPTVRILLSKLNAFRMSLPPHMRRPTQAEKLDTDLFATVCTLHGAVIVLGEPLITKETWTQELGRLSLSAIRAMLSLIYDLTATSYDITLLPATCSYHWFVCCRALMRFMDAAVSSGDSVSATVFRSEIDVFRMSIQQYGERFPLGLRHLDMVNEALAEREVLGSLPEDHFRTMDNKQIFDINYIPTEQHRSSATPSAGGSSRTPGSTGAGSSNLPASIGQVTPCTSPDTGTGSLTGDMGFTKDAGWTGGGGWDASSFSFDPDVIAQFLGPELTFNPNDFAFNI